MTILAQYPTCRNPSCIHRIETHRQNLLRIGSKTYYTSNSYLHCPNDTQQPPSNTSTIDPVPIATNNLSLAQPISNHLDSITNQKTCNQQPTQSFCSCCPSYPLPNNPTRYSIYHTNLFSPIDPPTVSLLPTSPNITAYPTNGSTSLWSQPTLFNNIWNLRPSTFITNHANYEPSATCVESIRNHANQDRAISCISDQPLN